MEEGIEISYDGVFTDLVLEVATKVRECVLLKQEALAWKNRCLKAEAKLNALITRAEGEEHAGKMEE